MDQAITWGNAFAIMAAYIVPVGIFGMATFAWSEWEHRQWVKWQRLAEETKDPEAKAAI